MSRRVTKDDVRALVKVVNSLAHHLGLIEEGFTLGFQPGSRANGEPHYLYVQRDADSGRQRTHVPDFVPELDYHTTLPEAFGLLTATKLALTAVANHADRESKP